MHELDRAWAAGFFDAEGHFGAKISAIATASQTSLEPLDILTKIVGEDVFTIGGPYEKSSAKIRRKPQWVCWAYGKRALAVFDAIEPWLGEYRRSQGIKALQLSNREASTFALHPWPERIAWAAGFFDGEGSFMPGDTLRVGITNTDAELLHRFQQTVGLGKVYGPYKPSPNSNVKKLRYLYSAWNFETVQAVFAMLWPFLGSAKRLQGRAVLDDYLTVRRCGHLRGPVWSKHCPICFKPGPKNKKRPT